MFHFKHFNSSSPRSPVTRAELLEHLTKMGYVKAIQIEEELMKRDYATDADCRATLYTLFEESSTSFKDQSQNIKMLLDRTLVMSAEFEKKAKEATDNVDTMIQSLQARQTEVTEHFKGQLTLNTEGDVKIQEGIAQSTRLQQGFDEKFKRAEDVFDAQRAESQT